MSTKIKCSFCEGKGKDPFNLLSKASQCQVCNGLGNS
jgi:DnaJ-class molecular chaperone